MKFVDNNLKKFWMGHENTDITAQYAVPTGNSV
jgi:hypothetical protein